MNDGEPKWAIVLRTIYENKMAGRDFNKYGQTGLSRQVAIAEEAGLKIDEVYHTIYQLVEQGLVTDIGPSSTFQGHTLTEKGSK